MSILISNGPIKILTRLKKIINFFFNNVHNELRYDQVLQWFGYKGMMGLKEGRRGDFEMAYWLTM